MDVATPATAPSKDGSSPSTDSLIGMAVVLSWDAFSFGGEFRLGTAGDHSDGNGRAVHGVNSHSADTTTCLTSAMYRPAAAEASSGLLPCCRASM